MTALTLPPLISYHSHNHLWLLQAEFLFLMYRKGTVAQSLIQLKQTLISNVKYQLELNTYQLIQVILDSGQVGQRADGNQTTEHKVKELVTEKWDQPAYTMLRRNRKKEAPVNYLVKKASSNFKTMDYKYTYSNGTIHHHRTDCEHEEGDSKQNAGIFCIKRKTVRISHFLELSHCS